MRVAGRLAAQARELVGSHVAPGVTTDELDRIGHEFLCDHGAYPSTLGYRGFPKSLCSSVNEVVCHGIPDSRVVQDGDIVNIDITAYLDGVHGDTNATFLAGDVDEETRLLVERTREALDRGDQGGQARPPDQRHRPGDRVLRRALRVRRRARVHRPRHRHRRSTRAWSSRTTTTPAYDDLIEVGMTFTIEPMLNLGTHEWDDVGRRLDGRHRGSAPQRAVRAHAAGHPRPGPRS